MVTDQPTRHTVRGALVHRAVGMRWAKPAPPEAVWEAVTLSAGALVTALRKPDRENFFSSARALSDGGGAWWSKIVDDFATLADEDREWVLDHVAKPAKAAGRALADAALAETWRWMWSEMPLVGGSVPRRPIVSRPDLVVGIGGDQVLVVDLKLGHYAEPPFALWSQRLAKVGLTAIENWVLEVNGGSNARWIRK